LVAKLGGHGIDLVATPNAFIDASTSNSVRYVLGAFPEFDKAMMGGQAGARE